MKGTTFNFCKWNSKPVWVLTFLAFVQSVSSYKHVIFMHGLLGKSSEFNQMEGWLAKFHPNTTTTVIDAYLGVQSLIPLWNQVKYIRKQMSDVMKAHPEGVHLLCFSQGGLVCRGVLQTLPDHNVQNFISLSSPQGGQFGDTSVLRYLFPTLLRDKLYLVFYSRIGQDVSVANYWNDPHHQELYRDYSDFLAVLNNDSSNAQSHEYKKNFLRIKQLVLVGGPDDGVIAPWQSSQFGAYDKNLTVVPMDQQPKWYGQDSFGLRTLHKRGAIHMDTVPGVQHFDWHKKEYVFQKYIAPWLT